MVNCLGAEPRSNFYHSFSGVVASAIDVFVNPSVVHTVEIVCLTCREILIHLYQLNRSYYVVNGYSRLWVLTCQR